MKNTIRYIINDTCQGDMTALKGLVDYLRYEKGYPLTRIAKIAERKFYIDFWLAMRTLVRAAAH